MLNYITCSFTERILIKDRKTRQQLTTYAKKGLSSAEIQELKQLVAKNCPYMEPLLVEDHSASNSCPEKWKKFVASISSSSPVCSMIPPIPETIDLIQELLKCDKKIKADPMVYYL